MKLKSSTVPATVSFSRKTLIVHLTTVCKKDGKETIRCKSGDLPNIKIINITFSGEKGSFIMRKKIFYFVLLGVITTVFAQQDSIVQLPTVQLSDIRLKAAEAHSIVVKLSDSVLQNNTKSFTSLLRQNTTLYFKEYGAGMTSSVSFRGTNASQTAVIWNGININSQTTGQTDFNNVAMGGFNTLTVKSGGGSAFYGSGAIGGSVHLGHHFKFEKALHINASSSVGSFDNYINSANVTLSNPKSTFNGYVRYQNSDNDYKYLGSKIVNENGEIENFSAGYNFANRVSKKDIIKAYYSYFTNVRNLSRTLTAPSKSRLDNKNTRTLINWEHQETKTTYNLRIANLEEEFIYYENKRKKHLGTGSEVSTYIVKADVDYKLNKKIQLKGAIDANLIEGEGDNIGKNTRRSIAGIVSLTHKPFQKLKYQITARQEGSNLYRIPLIGSFTANYQLFKHYKIGVEASKNYRIPTYNDLYWTGLGNPNLKPESSIQTSFNHFFTYKKTSLQVAGFYIDTKDMIKWTPDDNGIWHPQNFVNVKNYGAEAILQTQLQYRKHQLHVSATYAYTKAIDQETDKQLIYVPLQKVNGNVHYQFKKIGAFFETSFTDEVFTNGNNTKALKGYAVSNAGISFNTQLQQNNLSITARVNNMFSKRYEVLASRPMPNRNFLITINYKYN